MDNAWNAFGQAESKSDETTWTLVYRENRDGSFLEGWCASILARLALCPLTNLNFINRIGCLKNQLNKLIYFNDLIYLSGCLINHLLT